MPLDDSPTHGPLTADALPPGDPAGVAAPRRCRGPALLAAFALAILVAGVFWPMVTFEFVNFDTDAHVVKNPYIRGLTWRNVTHILTTRAPSYRPVRTLTYALDYELWGLNPAGFKLTNGLLHLSNVLLVFWIILRVLDHHSRPLSEPSLVPPIHSRGAVTDSIAAALGAALFAVHPVVVEPVAWVPGREELLTALGGLGCFHLHLTARRLDGDRARRLTRRACYAGAALCCAAACLSSAVGAAIPPIVTAWDALALPRPRFWKIVRGTGVLWLIGIAAVAGQGFGVPSMAAATVPRVFSRDWLLMIASVYWLNLKALIGPTELGILYEWIPSYGFRAGEVFLGATAILATPVVLWALRRHKAILFGLAWFVLALAPTSQIKPHQIARADRFLYLPLAGVAIAGAAALVILLPRVRRRPAKVALAAAGLIVIAAAAWLSTVQLQTWRNSYTMWENCLRVSPINPLARRAMAEILSNRGRFDLAIPHYHMALRVEPDNVDTLQSFAVRLATCEEDLRDCDLAIRLARRGCEITRWNDPGLRRALAIAYVNSALDLQDDGQYAAAIGRLREAIRAEPHYDVALFNLAALLTISEDPALRRPAEAVELAERACQLAGRSDPGRLRILAMAYAAAGNRTAAVATFTEAIRRAQLAGDAALVSRLQQQLDACRATANHQ